jgi:hypothetical protein
MRIIPGEPAVGKPPKIICTGCGKRAFEAGIAVAEDAVEENEDAGIGDVYMAIEEKDVHPLCAECVTALLRGEDSPACGQPS